MKHIVLVGMFVVLAGCGTIAPDGNYALVAEGAIDGALGPGSVHACKVTTKGDTSGWVLQYRGERCTAVLNQGR